METNLVGASLFGTQSKADKAAGSLANDFSHFLTLLTTQLKNQDPLSPTDATEFTNQLVQFTGVEQQVSMNKNLEQMIKLQQGAQSVAAVGFLDRNVEAFSNQLMVKDGSATEFAYTLDKTAKDVKVTIKDEKGAIVRTMSGANEAGAHNVSWDGKSDNGLPAADGKYSFSISAVDDKDKAVTATTTITGRVESVTVDKGALVLDVAGLKLPVAHVLSVKPVAPTQSN